MIKLITKLPRSIYVACSGGVDSMVALDFLRRNHTVSAVFFDHNTSTSSKAKEFVTDYCHNNDIHLVHGCITRGKNKSESWEEYWRIQRYEFFDQLDLPVITAHHLDDAVETWIWSSLHGNPKLPMVYKNNCIRPFLTTPKTNLVKWATNKSVPWIEDKTNLDTEFTRNFIRHHMMDCVLNVNPGIRKTIQKKVLETI